MGWNLNIIHRELSGIPRALAALSGYSNELEGTQHVLYQGLGDGTGDQRIYELYWKPKRWHIADLMATGPSFPTIGAPSGYVFTGTLDGNQHVVYLGFVPGQGGDGHIHEISWTQAQVAADVTTHAGAEPALSDPFGFDFFGQQVVYTGSDNHTHYLRYFASDGSWVDTDLFLATSLPGRAAATRPSAYGFGAQNTLHVLALGGDQHVLEFWALSGPGVIDLAWHPNDLTAVGGGLPANGTPTGYGVTNPFMQLVHYRGIDGHLHQLRWQGGTWKDHDLTLEVGGPPVAADQAGAVQAGYDFAFEGTQHVFFVGADRHVYEYWQGGGAWHLNDLTLAAGAPLAGGSPTAYVFGTEGTQHVMFTTMDGEVVELWWQP